MEKIVINEPKVFYHFTCSFHLPDIMESGFLNLSESIFSFEQMEDNPVVWLTASPSPENNGLLFDDNIPDFLNKTHIRFTIRSRPYIKQWDAWSDAIGIDAQQKQRLILSASAENTYENWYISEQPIQLATDAICVENLHTGQILKF